MAKPYQTLISNRAQLESRLSSLKLIIDKIKCYTLITDRVNASLANEQRTQVKPINIHRMFNKLTITDEYLCRLVIQETELFLEEIKAEIEKYSCSIH